jgi:queuine/archaeosine tRNA-ribosyltransferase
MELLRINEMNILKNNYVLFLHLTNECISSRGEMHSFEGEKNRYFQVLTFIL